MQNFRALGLRPQTPVPPAAGGFAPKPPLASGGWMLHHPPHTAPQLRISGYAPTQYSSCGFAQKVCRFDRTSSKINVFWNVVLLHC